MKYFIKTEARTEDGKIVFTKSISLDAGITPTVSQIKEKIIEKLETEMSKYTKKSDSIDFLSRPVDETVADTELLDKIYQKNLFYKLTLIEKK